MTSTSLRNTEPDWVRAPHRTIFLPNLDRLLPAECHFNPSLVQWDGRIWMVYRRVSTDEVVPLEDWPRTLGICCLDASLQADISSNLDLSARIVDPPGARHWHADARFFIREGRPALWYHDNHDMFMFDVDLHALPNELRPKRLVLTGRKRRERERNWGIFDDGSLKAVYSIDPHLILELEPSESEVTARPRYETGANIPWDIARWGEPHGGSSPIRIGCNWYSFFHSSSPAYDGAETRIYRVGFYGFDVEPPHRIRHMSRRPIFEGPEFDGPLSFWRSFSVAYPSGAIFSNGTWLVSIGIHDRAIGFVTLNHQALVADCVRM